MSSWYRCIPKFTMIKFTCSSIYYESAFNLFFLFFVFYLIWKTTEIFTSAADVFFVVSFYPKLLSFALAFLFLLHVYCLLLAMHVNILPHTHPSLRWSHLRDAYPPSLQCSWCQWLLFVFSSCVSEYGWLRTERLFPCIIQSNRTKSHSVIHFQLYWYLRKIIEQYK